MSSRQVNPSCVSSGQKMFALSVAVLCVVTAGSFATLSGLLTSLLIEELNWAPIDTVLGITLNMILYGATAPFAIFLMEKYGVKKIVVVSILLLCLGGILSTIHSRIIFNLAWGILVGPGCGSLTMSFGALFARLWFQNTGLPTGILTASSVTGQFVLLPFWAMLASAYGWQAPLVGSVILSVTTLVILLVFLNEKFSALETVTRSHLKPDASPRDIYTHFIEFCRDRRFWVISLAFGMCGATTNGLMWSNFTPAAAVEGISMENASFLLLIIGVMNIPGTIAAGWLSDKYNHQIILAFIFALRGASLVFLPFILSQPVGWELMVFAVIFGIFDVATVPPVISICNDMFGERGPSAFSWVNVFHQVGAGIIALAGGLVFYLFGSYFFLWLLAGAICFMAIPVVLSSYHKINSNVA